MFKQFCRACGNQVTTEGHVPLEYCTNCGARLMPETQDYAPNRPTLQYDPGKNKKANGTNKILIGLAIAVPVLFILAGIAVAFIAYLAISNKKEEVRNFPTPQRYVTPPKTSNSLLTIGKDGIGQGEFKNAEGLAVDKEGNIYVGDGTLRIQKFDSSGKFLQLWNVTEGKIKADEKYTKTVTNLVVDSKNRVYAAVARKELFRYDGATGKFIDKIELYGDKFVGTPQEAYIMDMVLLNDDSLVILANSFPEGEYIMTVSPEGKAAIKFKDILKKQDKDRRPLLNGSLLVNVTGEMFLTDNMVVNEKSYMYRFKSDGSYVDRFTWDGAPNMPLFFRKIIALNSKGEIYAYSREKSQINVLSVEGISLRTIPLKTDFVEKLILDQNDNIFVVSSKKVEKFAPSGS